MPQMQTSRGRIGGPALSVGDDLRSPTWNSRKSEAGKADKLNSTKKKGNCCGQLGFKPRRDTRRSHMNRTLRIPRSHLYSPTAIHTSPASQVLQTSMRASVLPGLRLDSASSFIASPDLPSGASQLFFLTMLSATPAYP